MNTTKTNNSLFKSICLLLVMLLSMSFYSCKKEEIPLADQENEVEFRIYTDTPDVLVKVFAYPNSQFVTKNRWEKKYFTKNESVRVTALCDDITVLLTAEIYVNGKLKARDDGNRSVDAHTVIK